MKKGIDSKKVVERYVDSILFIREYLKDLDSIINPILGIKDWDDSACIKFGNEKLVVSIDGPYTKRLVMKSALVHATTDVVVKGAVPLFAMDSMIGNRNDVEDMIKSLKIQAEKLKIPILGGNTLLEDSEPRCTICVIGKLLLEEPIRDSTSMSNDILVLLGEPIWGEQAERLEKALKLFDCWFSIIKEVKINAAKDVTKGGLLSCIHEMEMKSGLKFELFGNIELPLTRNLDNFLISIRENNFHRIKKIAAKKKCPVKKIGFVSG